jgi:TonB family protein
MINVAFLLLIFFLMSATLIAPPPVPVRAPTAAEAPAPQPGPVLHLSVEGVAAAAAPGAGGTARAAYGDLLRAAIARHREHSRAAQRVGWQGTAIVTLVIAADGRLIALSLRQSAGRGALDAAALAAAGAAAPFSPPPGGALAVLAPVAFMLR